MSEFNGFVEWVSSMGVPVYTETVEEENWVHIFTDGTHEIHSFDRITGTYLSSWETSMRWGRKITA